MIETEIADRGLPYETALVQDGTSSTLPLAFDPSVGVTNWLNFTDRIAVLKRTDVPTLDAVSGQYMADELRNVVAADLDGVTIIAGDLNSDAARGRVRRPGHRPTKA